MANQQQGSAGRKAAPRRNAGPQIVVSEEFAGPTVLFLATRNGRQEMDVASRAWVGRYREDKMGAVGGGSDVHAADERDGGDGNHRG